MLLRHVLSSMPLHLLSVLNTPESVFKKIQGMFSSFFWGEHEGKNKKKWKAWKKLCNPTDEGGYRREEHL